MESSDIALLNEQICHLVNSHSQNCRKGINLMLSESFMNMAIKDLQEAKNIMLSAEEYARFSQAEIFVHVVKDCGLILLDLSDILKPIIHLFICFSCDVNLDQSVDFSKISTIPELTKMTEMYIILVTILSCIFKRDIHRLRALDKNNISKEYYVVNLKPDGNATDIDRSTDRIRKTFLFTTIVTFLVQGNPWPMKVPGGKGKRKEEPLYNKYLEFFYDLDKNEIVHDSHSSFSTMTYNYFKRNMEIIVNILNNTYIAENDLFSTKTVFQNVLALLGHFLCFHKSVFTLTGMGVDDDFSDGYSSLTFSRFFSDFIERKLPIVEEDNNLNVKLISHKCILFINY